MKPLNYTFHIWFIFLETVIVLLFGFCFKVADYLNIMATINKPLLDLDPGFWNLYPLHQDIIVMGFIGLTLILAYQKYNGVTNVSVGFMCGALAIQSYILFRAFWWAIFNNNWTTAKLDFSFFITSLYALIAVQIVWGALAGKVGPCQMTFVTLIVTFMFALNEEICFSYIVGFDLGGSSSVYAYGGFFALVVGLVTWTHDTHHYDQQRNSTKDGHSVTFALIGTLLLWVMWPSLNAARVSGYLSYGFPWGNQVLRAVFNTVFALTGSVIGSYIISALAYDNQFNVEHVLKATLAGGVIIGGSSDLCNDPFSAILAGSFAGSCTVIAFENLQHRLKGVDSLGSSLLFLYNGFFGGVLSAIYICAMSDSKFGLYLRILFPMFRTTNNQGGAQLAILGVSLCSGLVGGLVAGILVRWCSCYKPSNQELYAQDAQIIYPANEFAKQVAVAGNTA